MVRLKHPGVIGVLLFAASCTDRAPFSPVVPAGGGLSAFITCAVAVMSRSITCGSPSSPMKADLQIGGQGVYVALRSTNVGFNAVTDTFQADVTVQNLMAQTLGVGDGKVRVFFVQNPAAPVVTAADSVGTFTNSGQSYFVYNDSVPAYGVSAARTWKWALHGDTSFTFAVAVDAKVEEENGILRWTPQTTTSTFNSIWGVSANAVYAVTQEGSIWRYDGTTWKDLPAGGFNGLEGVWGSDTNDIYAVGGNGNILHFDGKSWLSEASGTTNSLAALSGSSNTDIYAVGDAGTILHFDGTVWSGGMTGDTAHQNFASVWVATTTAVYATGSLGQLWKWDGNTWAKLGALATPANCFSVWASSATNVFAACAGGVLLHYDGTSITTIASGQTNDLSGVWGPDSSDVYVVGDNGTVIHSTTGGLTWPPAISDSFTGNLLSVWGLNSSTIYLGGAQGTIQQYDGTTLGTPLHEHTDELNSVWGTSAINAYAVGGSGVVVHYNGTSWTTSATVSASFLNSVWGSAANDLYTVGQGDGAGDAIVYHSTTGTAFDSDLVAVSTDGNLNAVWGASDTSIYAVGDGGLILHGKTGGPWGAQTVGSLDLLGVWGTSNQNVWAVGASGAIAHFNGSWTSTTQGTEDINGIWAADSTHMFAVTSGGSILTYDGSTWTTLSAVSPTPLIAVWGTSPTDVYAAGGSTLLHYNGSAWTVQTTGISTASLSLLSVWGSSSTDVLAVGSGIYHGVR